MENRWNPQEAARFADQDLAMRVYSSRLLGQDTDLVLHGGGNTSVKSITSNIFGEQEEVLYVKGSGWDLRTIEAAGFAPARLAHLQRLAQLERLSDSQMMQQLRLALLDPAAPTPSVEAILHAIIPSRYVDHTHTDAVVALSNTAQGPAILQQLFGGEVLILPYIMPGFVLARQVYLATRQTDWGSLRGLLLLHHGLFTFADEARQSYDAMIELVTRAEHYLESRGCTRAIARARHTPTSRDYRQVAEMRRKASELAGHPLLARWLRDEESIGFSALPAVAEVASRGPLTPDHTIHTKLRPAIVNDSPSADLDTYARDYRAYFARHDSGTLTCLDPAPRFAVWRGRGMLCFAEQARRLQVVEDIAGHTIKAIQWGEALGGWQALPEEQLFEVEYWELEQAKLKKGGQAPQFAGKVVLITGAASGIGRACVEEFTALGACVLALDINPAITALFSAGQVLGRICDVTDAPALRQSIEAGVEHFGGLDVVVSNAGSFTASQCLEQMQDEDWQRSLDLNLTAHMKLLREAQPYLAQGLQPALVFVASKNVPAPGPGAGAYSSAKAGLTQLARVAALELGPQGIRVNVLHPNAVFDTAVWTEDVLAQRAAHYQLSIEEYRRNNVLGVEVTSRDVARLARCLAGPDFSRTTGAQVPVDGGNERVI